MEYSQLMTLGYLKLSNCSYIYVAVRGTKHCLHHERVTSYCFLYTIFTLDTNHRLMHLKKYIRGGIISFPHCLHPQGLKGLKHLMVFSTNKQNSSNLQTTRNYSQFPMELSESTQDQTLKYCRQAAIQPAQAGGGRD